MTTESEFFARENEQREKLRRLKEFGEGIGSGFDFVEMLGEFWFDTWQEALDFQTLAQEQGIEVRLIEPDAKVKGFGKDKYKICIN